MANEMNFQARWRIGVASLALVVVLGACSTTTSTTSPATVKTTTAPPSTTTAAPTTRAPATTRGGSSPVHPTLAAEDLEAFLPTAADIGAGYKVSTESDDSGGGSFDEAMTKACPELAELMGNRGGDGPDAERTFKTEDGREVSVELTAGALQGKVPNPAKMQAFVDAVNACDGAKATDDGVDMTVTMSARTNDDFGDFGATIELQVRGVSAQLPKPLVLNGVIQVFVVGDVGVFVSTMGGVDMETFEGIPADSDIGETESARLTAELAKVQDH